MSRNKTVLVLSDRPEQFDLTAKMFRKDGYTVLFERNMRESLRVAEAESPTLMISELAVPDIDGLELCIRARRNASLTATPIMLVGDLSEGSSIVADSLRCGAAYYLQKPFDSIKLFEVCCGVGSFKEQVILPARDENTF
jgi:DNA-binding response OmpR family regulator